MVYNINGSSWNVIQVTVILASLGSGRLITSSIIAADTPLGHTVNKSCAYVDSIANNTLDGMNRRTINIVDKNSFPLSQLVYQLDQSNLNNQIVNIDMNELINQFCTLVDKVDKVKLKELHRKLAENMGEPTFDKLIDKITIARDYQYKLQSNCMLLKVFIFSFTGALTSYLATSLVHYIYTRF